MGQCLGTKSEKVYLLKKGNAPTSRETANRNSKPTEGNKKINVVPHNVPIKAVIEDVQDGNSLPVKPVDGNNPAVEKKDVSVKPDIERGAETHSSPPLVDKPSARTKKHRRKKKTTPTECDDSRSSGSTESSESSKSSDSKHDVKKKTKRTGNKTVHSITKSKTIVNGNHYTCDNRGGQMTINNIQHQTVVENLFVGTGYDLKEALEVEKNQRNKVPAGNFVNLREIHLAQETVLNVDVRVKASEGVGYIQFECFSGTCFRVGKNKIMTALHIVKAELDAGQPENEGSNNKEAHIAALPRLNNGFVDFTFLKFGHQHSETTKFKLKPIMSIEDIHFFDHGTDCIILELQEPNAGMKMPPPFRFFSYPRLEEGFHIIGHSKGREKTFDHVDRFIDPEKEQTKKDKCFIKTESSKFLKRHNKSEQEYPFDVANSIDSKERCLFNCTFVHGASGAPGVVVDREGKVVVVTMFCCGYPDWYYGPISEAVKREWPKHYRVEQGANMRTICEKIHSKNPELCSEIFGCNH